MLIRCSMLLLFCGDHVVFVFFFQAEDGIRDLVRSRGLGDVYKRQACVFRIIRDGGICACSGVSACLAESKCTLSGVFAVSYTHLTLPTSDLV